MRELELPRQCANCVRSLMRRTLRLNPMTPSANGGGEEENAKTRYIVKRATAN